MLNLNVVEAVAIVVTAVATGALAYVAVTELRAIRESLRQREEEWRKQFRALRRQTKAAERQIEWLRAPYVALERRRLDQAPALYVTADNPNLMRGDAFGFFLVARNIGSGPAFNVAVMASHIERTQLNGAAEHADIYLRVPDWRSDSIDMLAAGDVRVLRWATLPTEPIRGPRGVVARLEYSSLDDSKPVTRTQAFSAENP